MGTKMNKETYSKIIENYIIELDANSEISPLSRNHINVILNDSINRLYSDNESNVKINIQNFIEKQSNSYPQRLKNFDGSRERFLELELEAIEIYVNDINFNVKTDKHAFRGIAERKLEHMRKGKFKADIMHYIDTGIINKSFLDALNSIVTECEANQQNYTKENEFPVFWYESNACWGNVKNMEDLKEKCVLQTDPKYGALKDKEMFLDRSKQNSDGSLDFGTRREHRGDKTLREFLVENKVDFSEL